MSARVEKESWKPKRLRLPSNEGAVEGEGRFSER